MSGEDDFKLVPCKLAGTPAIMHPVPEVRLQGLRTGEPHSESADHDADHDAGQRASAAAEAEALALNYQPSTLNPEDKR